MIPLEYQPGIVKVDSAYSQPGRFIDGNNVRFVRNRAEKMKGFERLGEELMYGVCRAIHAWDDGAQSSYIAAGTNRKLYVADADGVLTDITPIRDSGTLTDPFETTDGSSEVLVHDDAHGAQPGDTVIFSNAEEAVGGLTIDGSYLIEQVLDANTYTIDAGSPATSSATGGGSVDYEYEVVGGNLNVVRGGGFGVGRFGEGTFGTERVTGSFLQFAHIWALKNYGNFLIGQSHGGSLYYWDPNGAPRAAKIANSPEPNLYMFVTDTRHVIVLGAGGDPMKIQWPDQNDFTDWEPTDANDANSRVLQNGSRLIAGTQLTNTLNLIWSDTALYRAQYTGSEFVFDTAVIGDQCGLFGPNAFVTVSGMAFWMSGQDFHAYSGGGVTSIPNAEDVRQWVFELINRNPQNWKATCGYNPRFNEVWWHFVPEGELEPTHYVAVNVQNWTWVHGERTRTALTTQESLDQRPLGAAPVGDEQSRLYVHETGLDADGEPMPWHLEYAPFDIAGGDQTLDLCGFIPDFERQAGTVDLTITTHDYPADEHPLETEQTEIPVKTGMVDIWIGGRQVGFRMSGNALGSDFRLGKPRVEVKGAGLRR